jgi:hypothetical protein
VFTPETVVLPPELEISIVPRDVIGAPLVIVEALESLTVAALMAPVPVLTVDVEPELLITTSPPAVKVAVVLAIEPLVRSSIFPEVV